MAKAARTAAKVATLKTPARATSTRKRSSSSPSPQPQPKEEAGDFHAQSLAARYTYRIGRGEEGVLTLQPWKGRLLPHWRFKTPDIARESSGKLWTEFEEAVDAGDFPWSDMARKFLQMGMTRATRYGRRAGGRKYDKETGELLPTSDSHPGSKEKLESAAIFREAWERAKEHEGYKELRKVWEKEKKARDKSEKEAARPAKRRKVKEEEDEPVKQEVKVEAE
ncbi:hypothetical protein JCM11641_001198 [Rhodosporidiobolus odoratus]